MTPLTNNKQKERSNIKNIIDGFYEYFIMKKKVKQIQTSLKKIDFQKWNEELNELFKTIIEVLIVRNFTSNSDCFSNQEYLKLFREKITDYTSERFKLSPNIFKIIRDLDSRYNNAKLKYQQENYFLDHIWEIFEYSKKQGSLTTIQFLYSWSLLLLIYASKRKYPISPELLAFVLYYSDLPKFENKVKAKTMITKKILPILTDYQLMITDPRYKDYFATYLKDGAEKDLMLEYLYANYSYLIDRTNSNSTDNDLDVKSSKRLKYLQDILYDDEPAIMEPVKYFRPMTYPKYNTKFKDVTPLNQTQSINLVCGFPLSALKLKKRIPNILYNQTTMEFIGDLVEYPKPFHTIHGISRKKGELLQELVHALEKEDLKSVIQLIHPSAVREYQEMGGYFSPAYIPRNEYHSFQPLTDQFSKSIQSYQKNDRILTPFTMVEWVCKNIVDTIQWENIQVLEIDEKKYNLLKYNWRDDNYKINHTTLELHLQFLEQMIGSNHPHVKIHCDGPERFTFDWVYTYQKAFETDITSPTKLAEIMQVCSMKITSILSHSYYKILEEDPASDPEADTNKVDTSELMDRLFDPDYDSKVKNDGGSSK